MLRYYVTIVEVNGLNKDIYIKKENYTAYYLGLIQE